MQIPVLIRSEGEADCGAIAEVTRVAFADLEISSHTEQFMIAALRRAGALAVSLVAEHRGEVVGHVAFSPIGVSDGSPGWFGLGPVSVLPAYQRQGVGRALIEAGLKELKQRSAAGCCVVGHPAYYPRFGFERSVGLRMEGVPPEAFFALSFGGPMPAGTVTFHAAFEATGPETG